MTSHIGKVYERLLIRRLLRWLRYIRAIPLDQAATQVDGSVLQHISLLGNAMAWRAEVLKKHTYLACLDLKKAFPD